MGGFGPVLVVQWGASEAGSISSRSASPGRGKSRRYGGNRESAGSLEYGAATPLGEARKVLDIMYDGREQGPAIQPRETCYQMSGT